ncbi:DUF4097 family beta strand repeat protein [candidate division KSB1 bacterium]|nr:DUF4097 family beta strand repeat protein [candidate division KSB1 bacterium]
MKTRYFLMRLLPVLTGLSLLILSSGCNVNGTIDVGDGNGDNRYTASDPINLRVGVAGHTGLEVNNINGPVEVYGVNGIDEIEITGERIVRSDSQHDADEHLNSLQVSLRDAGSMIIVETEQPSSSDGREYEVRYKIRIPDNWDVTVNLTNGIVTVESISGNVEADVTNGNVNVTDVVGSVSVDLTNGNADLRDINGNVEVDLTNGIIFTQMNWTTNRQCKLSTTNGGIELRVPETASADFTASVSNGEISLTGLTLHDLVSSPRSVHGRLGNGEGRIELKTVNGSILAVGY